MLFEIMLKVIDVIFKHKLLLLFIARFFHSNVNYWYGTEVVLTAH